MKALFPTILFSLSVLISLAEEEATVRGFFPIDPSGKRGLSEFQEQWYSKHLKIMKEKPLEPLAEDHEVQVYRFTLLPTWGDPQCVRLCKDKDGAVMHYSRLNGDGGYDPGRLVESRSLKISKGEAAVFLKLFQEAKFFTQPSRDAILGLDGSEWILEAVSEGRYHVVARWTASAYDPKKRGTVEFVRACEWLLTHAPAAE